MAIPRAYARFLRKYVTSILITCLTLLYISSYNKSSQSASKSPSLFSPPLLHLESEAPSSLHYPMENVISVNLQVKENGYIEHGKENGDSKHVKENGDIGYGVVKENENRNDFAYNEKKHEEKPNVLVNLAISDARLQTKGRYVEENKTTKGDNSNTFEEIRRTNEVRDNENVYPPPMAVSDLEQMTSVNLTRTMEPPPHRLSTMQKSLVSSTPAAFVVNSSSHGLSTTDFKYRYEDIIDKGRKTKILWRGYEDCQKYKVHFAKRGALPICALASYPGSGNTWTRSLLEYSAGVFTGSIYSDQQLFVNGYYGELETWNAGTTLTQKTHDSGPSHVETFNGSAVLLLRNPYRAILSFHNYLFAGHTGFAPMSNYRRKDWGKFVHLQVKTWLELAINWTTMANPESLTVIHYETLKVDLVSELSRVLRRLGFLPDMRRLDCLKRLQSYESFKRGEEFVPEKLEMFGPDDKDKIDRAIRYVDYLLRKHGQEPLPLHLYEFYNGNEVKHITSVICEDYETEAQCDDRVDRYNNIRKTRKGLDVEEERSKRRRGRRNEG